MPGEHQREVARPHLEGGADIEAEGLDPEEQAEGDEEHAGDGVRRVEALDVSWLATLRRAVRGLQRL